MIKVLLVEDRKMSRDCMTGYIKSSDRYQLAAHTQNAGMAEILCMQNKIDLILMDVCTANNEDGIEATAAIKRHFPNIKVIIVTGMTTIDLIDRARAANADSFWYKELNDEPIMSLMDRTMAGESIFPDKTPEVMLGEASSYEFSDREFEVLRELISGDTNEEIARRLYISQGTVKIHIQHMLEKTGFRSRTELAVRARESGLVIP